MNSFLIVGFGNTIRGDDGLGPFVAESLETGQLPPGARPRIAILPQLDLSLVAELPEADLAIFVDARQDDDATLVRVDSLKPQKTLEQDTLLSHSTHSMAISVLLSIASKWYGKELPCYLIQPKGFDFSFRETLSEQGAAAAACAKRTIYKILWAHYQDTV